MNEEDAHQIYTRLLSEERAAELHAYVIGQITWWSHRTPVHNVTSIQRSGLMPNDTGAIYTPGAVFERFGRNPPVVCLAPFELSKTWGHLGHQMTPQALLAVHSDDLPKPIGLDWTFPDTWHLAEVKSAANPAKSDLEIFLEVVKASASLISYAVVPPESLLVWLTGLDETNPAGWPKLVELEESEVEASYRV